MRVVGEVRHRDFGIYMAFIPTTFQVFGRGKNPLQVQLMVAEQLLESTRMSCLSSRFEGLRNHVQFVSGGLGIFDGLLWCCFGVCSPGVCSRTTPCALTCGEDAVNHVDPVEERIEDEHDRV